MLTRLRLPIVLAAVAALAGLVAVAALAGCTSEQEFARVFEIERMAQVIGGPAAGARPGDYLLENDKIRAVIHGRHNERSTFPVANGSLKDLDIQRPAHRYGVGRGKDAFYELAPMVNLKVSNAKQLAYGACGEVGDAPCPDDNEACVRVTASGEGENIMGIIGLLDYAIKRELKSGDMVLTTDYDLCPGEAFVRVTSTVRFDKAQNPKVVQMEDLEEQTGLLDVLLGEHTGQDCAKSACQAGEKCEDLLRPLAVAGFNMEMKRCRKPSHKVAGVLAGDYTLFSGKVRIFVPGSGFDHESYIRSLFDTGGDVFSAPLSMRAVAGVADGVSYAYFTRSGEVMIPIFSGAFTASMASRFACLRSDPGCLDGKKLRFERFVSTGHGDVASAFAALYQLQQIPTGTVEGHVIDARTRKPLSDIDVFVFKTPRAWARLSDQQIAARTHADLMQAHRAETRSKGDPEGQPGIISHFRTDIGLDQVKDGSFGGPLAVAGPASLSCRSRACRYIMVAVEAGRPVSSLHPVAVGKGAKTRVTLVAAEGATLEFDVQDPSGRPLPSKLTIGHCFAECARDEDCADRGTCDKTTRLCVPEGGYRGPADCRPDQRWDAAAKTCRCRQEGLLPLALGGHRWADNTIHVALTHTGKGQAALEPGTYQVITSRGFEYEIARHFVTLQPGMRRRIRAVLPRVVDTTGWISADFHVHGPNSVDSGLDERTRVRSYVAEGVELLTATDHDYLTDYEPTIFEMGLRPWIKSQTGLEVSPLDYGHFIGFPLNFDENAELNGAFHWRDPAGGGDGPDWKNMTPGGIFKKLRELGSLGVERTVVFVAHFYDYFTFYGLDAFDLSLPSLSITAFSNTALRPLNFSADFDALEAFNGKNMDIIRRPTYKEVRDFNVKLAQTIASAAHKAQSYDERQLELGALSAAAQRQFMHRTVAEQKLAIGYDNPSFECRCTSDEECGSSSICDEGLGACAPTCSSDSHCDATLVAAGREACKQLGSKAGRRTCQRLAQTCTKDPDCAVKFGSDSESCVKGACELSCTADKDCGDTKRPVCDASTSVCVAPTKATEIDPCVTVRGTVDDWFQLLNRGIRRPIMGNSDSHGTYDTEAGIPRNYVRSSSDLPQRIDTGEVADRVRAMRILTTYGPFVELTLDGQPVGSVVKVDKGKSVKLALKIQSPRWFDVDRVEVYRNGQLIKEIDGSTTCKRGSDSCIRVPNDRVVNYDASFTDKPDRDAWYVVAVLGLDGKNMAPVYSSVPVARLGMFELIQRLTPLLPPLRSLRTPLSPTMSLVRPYALTNPVWADIGGDGITPLAPMPGWAPARDTKGKQTSALRAEPPAHDHRHGLGRMVSEARDLAQALSSGQISRQTLQRALDQLRYMGR